MNSLSSATSVAAQKILLIGGCGYIGTFLYGKLIENGFHVAVCDRLARGNPLGIEVVNADYESLDAEFLAPFDAVLWFGGHSSVGQSTLDPSGAISNNCLNLFSFAKKLRAETKLIYASSGSLYSNKTGQTTPSSEISLALIPSQNAYDISKFAFDYLAQNFLKNFYALRMGTLSGYSPNIREELVFNAMNLSAVKSGKVRLMNSDSSRTILFLGDLWILIKNLLLTDQEPGIFNVGSYSFKMGELAQTVAATWGADIQHLGESETYSFLLDTAKMKAICGDELQAVDLPARCRKFIDEYKAGRGM